MVKEIDWSATEILLNVTREQVKSSPALASTAEIPQDYQERLHSHYSWPGYGWYGLAGECMTQTDVFAFDNAGIKPFLFAEIGVEQTVRLDRAVSARPPRRRPLVVGG